MSLQERRSRKPCLSRKFTFLLCIFHHIASFLLFLLLKKSLSCCNYNSRYWVLCVQGTVENRSRQFGKKLHQSFGVMKSLLTFRKSLAAASNILHFFTIVCMQMDSIIPNAAAMFIFASRQQDAYHCNEHNVKQKVHDRVCYLKMNRAITIAINISPCLLAHISLLADSQFYLHFIHRCGTYLLRSLQYCFWVI